MSTINLTEGTTEISAVLGDTVVVRLTEPGATGYQWSTEIDGEAVVEAYSTLQVAEDGPVAPGAGAVRIVGLRAEHPGACDVRFELRRPWEREQPPVERKALHVEVAE